MNSWSQYWDYWYLVMLSMVWGWGDNKCQNEVSHTWISLWHTGSLHLIKTKIHIFRFQNKSEPCWLTWQSHIWEARISLGEHIVHVSQSRQESESLWTMVGSITAWPQTAWHISLTISYTQYDVRVWRIEWVHPCLPQIKHLYHIKRLLISFIINKLL